MKSLNMSKKKPKPLNEITLLIRCLNKTENLIFQAFTMKYINHLISLTFSQNFKFFPLFSKKS